MDLIPFSAFSTSGDARLASQQGAGPGVPKAGEVVTTQSGGEAICQGLKHKLCPAVFLDTPGSSTWWLLYLSVYQSSSRRYSNFSAVFTNMEVLSCPGVYCLLL